MANSDVERLQRQRLTLIVVKSMVEALAANGIHAYIALAAAGRGGPERIERSKADILAALTRIITELAEDEMAYQDAERRGGGKSSTDQLILKRDQLTRQINRRLGIETEKDAISMIDRVS